MNNEQFEAETRWDVERYVLGDESLDREAFEMDMLADERLAWAVAEGVERLQRLSAACQALGRPANGSSAGFGEMAPILKFPAAARYALLACLALAASLMIALVVRDAGKSDADNKSELAAGDLSTMSVVATRWLAMDADSSITGSESQLATPFELIELSEQSQLFGSDEGDWMLEAAAEFYREAEI